ncbi:MAG: helix-turn-helix domain-containing protein, partial [Lachnospiraceae bacterium]|nr:helix-turn-helix domain-containing protein [Lachnospiraceae bacterium]
IKDTRISMNYTQNELAQLAGVSAITLSRLERGESVSMENMINVLRVLGSLPNMELLLQEQGIRPTDVADHKGKRKRVSRSKENAEKNTWMWGDESE